MAFGERFEQTAEEILSDYLTEVDAAFHAGTLNRASRESERNMREMERPVGVSEREKGSFRREIYDFFEDLRTRGTAFDYTAEPRIMAAVGAASLPRREDAARASWSSLARPVVKPNGGVGEARSATA